MPAGVHRNPYTYTGATTDEATGHHYLRNRVYNPTTTHFTTRDTANLLNRYAYAVANPHKYTDQTGNTPMLADWVSFGVGIGLALIGLAAAVLAVPTAGFAPVFTNAALLAATATLETVLVADAYEDFLPPAAEWALFGIGAATALTGVGNGVRRVSSVAAPSKSAAEVEMSVLALMRPESPRLSGNIVSAGQDVVKRSREYAVITDRESAKVLDSLSLRPFPGVNGVEYVVDMRKERMMVGVMTDEDFEELNLTLPSDLPPYQCHKRLVCAYQAIFPEIPEPLTVDGMTFPRIQAGEISRDFNGDYVTNEKSGNYGFLWERFPEERNQFSELMIKWGIAHRHKQWTRQA